MIGRTVWYKLINGKLVPMVVSDERGGHGIGTGDIDQDGRTDLLGPDGWHQAPARSGDPWIHHSDWTLGAAGISIIAHDFDDDGDVDLFWGMGHDYGLYWLEQGRNDMGQRTWTRHAVDEEWSQAHGLVLVDLDMDGKMEVLTGKRRHAHNGKDPGGDDPLIVCTYGFNLDSREFTKTNISSGGEVGAGHYPVPVDIDRDGDLDIVLPGKSGLYLLVREDPETRDEESIKSITE